MTMNATQIVAESSNRCGAQSSRAGGFGCVLCSETENSSNKLQIWKNVVKLTDTLLESNPYINITISTFPPNCVQMLCKFVCFNGRSSEIEYDINFVAVKNNISCNRIEELRLYSYEFPNNTIHYGFLGDYRNKVEILYLASSNISDVAAGAFANGVFQKIYFENLKLVQMRKDFFEGISKDFQSLSVIQREDPLSFVNGDFLDYVKYDIKYLIMQVGLFCVQNMTGSENLLSNLVYVDFSYNNFGSSLTDAKFSKLSMVEHMDLSHSNLEFLPAYIFAGFTSTLEYLDLSHNKLKTITRTIFGWHEIPRDMKIYANDNEWECSCSLQKDMKDIFVYQTTKLVCSDPQAYANWDVFDDRICEANAVEITTTTSKYILSSLPPIHDYEFDRVSSRTTTTELIITTTPSEDSSIPSSTPGLVELRCSTGMQKDDYVKQHLKWPLMDFTLRLRDELEVDVIIDNSESSLISSGSSSSSSSQEMLSETIGLIWFNKVTTQYQKMEVNYKEYGLGCYKSLSSVTTVSELIPNMAYTFCMVLHDQTTISPFNCKSIQVGSNLSIQSSAWITRDMKVTGLSLVVFGIVIFSFAGILMIYLLLKHKPILLKGSKRVTMASCHSGDIVVMPRAKSIKSIKEKESQLAIKSPLPHDRGRRKSTESVASYQSYMNANLYEIIPAYTQIENNNSNGTVNSESSTGIKMPASNTLPNSDIDNAYLTPLQTVSSSADLMNYAEIPYRSKRVSNDPLPEVPADQEPFYGVSLKDKGYPNIGVVYMLDSQV
uniref:LRRCT domain-containing protein n=1 Tax=Stomoxys calcitrans TaxID=35570 RepID=A0A1I8Q6K3_STOCA